MRTLFVATIVSLIACSAGRPAIHSDGKNALQSITVPVYAREASPSTTLIGRSFRPRTASETYRYKACSGIYVAPHVLVTSIGVLPKENDAGVTTYDLNAVFAGNPDRNGDAVIDIRESGVIAIMRTEDAGEPVRLREGEVGPGEHVTVIGHLFGGRAYFQKYAPSTVSTRPTVVIAGPRDDLLGLQPTYAVSAAWTSSPDDCGAAVVDSNGELAGIVLWRSGDRLSVMTIDRLRTLLREDDVPYR